VLQVAWLLPFLTFALLWMNPGNLYTLGFHYSPYVADQRLELERGGLTVPAEDANVYQQLVTEIQSRTAANAFILATPDCPEIYFLSGRRNPTPTLYDVFDVAPDRTARLLRMLDEKKIDLVVVNLKPAHSPPIDQELSAALKARYPKLMRIGSFVVATGSADVATK
jgi:hypothetical protein